MNINPLKKLEELGQSVWLDYIRRDLIGSGELRNMIENDGLKGMTSNPAIFEKAIAESDIYDKDIREMALSNKNVKEIYETISLRDVQSAADEFRPVYEKTGGRDGYVSLEVNPHLAYDTAGTIEEARRLWSALDRPNVHIKVPATEDGLPAIRQLISEGINVNVTLIFGLPRYRQVAGAYIEGLEMRFAQGKLIENIASVASFFLSRIDSLADPMIESAMGTGSNTDRLAEKALGQLAVASAKEAYKIYTEIFGSGRFLALAEKGAGVQRLLWASTGTKNAAYSDVKYIESLIGPDTVTTVPMETLGAYRDHGEPSSSLQQETEKAALIMELLPEIGIDIDKLTQQLEDEGVNKFNKPFDKLMTTILSKSSA